MNAILATSRRVRRTPFSPGVEAAGVAAYSVYNHMLLPAAFRSLHEDYHHLKRHVQVWDVACERQVSISGPDADRMLTMLSPRDLSKLQDGRCFYMPVIDSRGGMLNDPVVLRVAPEHYWISIADGDYLQYALGVADALGLGVTIEEPDVSPLGVQGPKADDLMARVFGDTVRDIRFFGFRRLPFEDRDLIVARSGYSKQGGFEIYVEGADLAMPLWNALFAAGEDLDVRAGCPNAIERIEGGLLSYGNDMTRENTPFEAGLGRYVNSPADYIGKAALAARPPERAIRPISISGDIPRCEEAWPLYSGDTHVGQITSAVFSPDFGTNVSIGMVAKGHWVPGTSLEVETPDGRRTATIEERFWA